jgi:hypothetical protein
MTNTDTSSGPPSEATAAVTVTDFRISPTLRRLLERESLMPTTLGALLDAYYRMTELAERFDLEATRQRWVEGMDNRERCQHICGMASEMRTRAERYKRLHECLSSPPKS